jgi:hypothetical protein
VREAISAPLITTKSAPTLFELFGHARVRDSLADSFVDAWFSGRFILRTRHSLVNDWRVND